MAPTPLEDLRDQVSGTRIEDGEDFLAWAPKAALLAALGEPEALSEWKERLGESGEELDELLDRRAREFGWDKEHADGEDLADTVLDAQEWFMFWKLAPGLLPIKSQQCLSAMADEAEIIKDDDAWKQAIIDWRETWCIPRCLLLTVVMDPVTLSDFYLQMKNVASLARRQPKS